MKKQYFFRFLFLFCLLLFTETANSQSKQTILRADIEAFGYQSLEQLLSSEVLGLEVNWAGQATTSVSMQGESGQRTLFIVDGVRQASFGSGLNDLSKLPLYTIEKIEVTKGAASTEYGSGAMAAVIDITTRKATEGAPSHEVEIFGRAGTSGNSFDNDDRTLSKAIKNIGAGLYAGFSTKKFTSTTTASYLGDNGYLLGSKATSPAVASYSALSATQQFGYRFSSHVKAEVKGHVFNKKSYLYQSGDANDINSLDGLSYGFNAAVIYDIDTLNKIVFSATSDYYKLTSQLNSSVDEGYTKHYIFTPSIVWYGRPHKNHNVTAAIEMRAEGLSNTKGMGSTTLFDDNFNTFSFYVRDRIRLTDKLSGTAGIRIEAFGIDDFIDLYESFVGKPKALQNLSVSPELELSYNLNRFNITALYTMGYRNPTLMEHSGISQTTYGMQPVLPINYSLRPERNHYIALEGNYSTKDQMFKTSLKIYESLYIHQLEATEIAKPNGYHYFANMGTGSTYGLEWLGEVEPLQNWRIKAGYSYVGESQKDERPKLEERLSYLRPHAAMVGTSYKIAHGEFSYQINIAGRYLSSITEDGSSAPGYGVLNAAISARYKKLITLTIGGENLLNKQIEAPLYATPIIKGINGYAQLAITF